MNVTLSNLKKIFGDKTAVDIPQFTVNHGDILGLVGNNGSGKTTMFRLILDLLKADDGYVSLTPARKSATDSDNALADPSATAPQTDLEETSSINPAESEEWKMLTGAYIDEGFLIDFLTPEEYIDFVAKVNGVPAIDWQHVEDSVIAPFLPFTNGEVFGQKKLIRDFSAGNKQKVGIISAMFAKPELVILDEPFNFLDPSGQNNLKKLIVDYHRQTRATILISSHNLQHTVDISTRIALLEHGHIINDMPNVNGSAEQALQEYFQVRLPATPLTTRVPPHQTDGGASRRNLRFAPPFLYIWPSPHARPCTCNRKSGLLLVLQQVANL